MHVFVTGASGFVGSVFLHTLLQRLGPSDRVYVLLRTPRAYADPRVIPLAGTLEAIENVAEKLLRAEYVFHLAANAALDSGADYEKVNAAPTASMVELLKQSRVLKRIIYTSSITAVDRHWSDPCLMPMTVRSRPSPTTGYGRSKLKGEQHILNSGLPFVILRPGFVYGRNMRADSHINRFVSMTYNRRLPCRLRFPGKVSLIHVEDLARAMVNCMDTGMSGSRIYFAETEWHAVGDIFSIIHEKLHKRRLKQIPVPSAHFLLGKFHSLMPATLAFLFLDYLWAQDHDFRRDLLAGTVCKKFEQAVEDVIETNPTVRANQPRE